MKPATVAVVITTKNRKDELRTAIESTLAQTAPVELVIIDDGSTDGTAEMVAREFPRANVHRFERSEGLIAQRNRGATLTGADVIVSIDDDCVFPSPLTIEQTLGDFDHPRVGVVSIPMINVRYDTRVLGQAPDRQRVWVPSHFQGGAHAMRRELFLRLGSYRAFLYRQMEESDFTIRMLDAGYVPRSGRAEPVHHLESPSRNWAVINAYNARNTLLYAWWNVPMPQLPVHWFGAHWSHLRHGVRTGHVWAVCRGLAWGYGAAMLQCGRRAPVRRATYRLLRRLVHSGSLPLDEIESELPPLDAPAA